MQAVHYDLFSAKNVLAVMDLNQLEKEQFLRDSANYTFKLCDIPVTLLPLLKSLSASKLAAVVIPESNARPNEVTDVLISGSEAKLMAISDNLKQQDGKAGELGSVIYYALERLLKKPTEKIHLGGHTYLLGSKTLIMGILNVTPDSFSDGGRFNHLEKALGQAYKIAEEGADIIDIGGESTRPGSRQITVDEELKRVMPVIKALKNDSNFKLPISIDTYKAAVAEQAMECGVEMLNDVWGLKKDKEIGKIAARYNVPICLMHNRHSTEYEDLIPNLIAELEESIDLAHRFGLDDNKIIIDPGIGFGKTLEQNLEIMLHLRSLCSLGYPLLLGTSRKSMIGKTLDLPVEERLEGTAATVACGIAAGADIVRVHDVMQMKRVAVMTDTMIRR